MKLGIWSDDCRTGGDRTKLSFWNTKFLGKYSVNLNLSNNYSLLYRSHLAMYQASLYLKTNLPVCLFTHSKGINIGLSCQELRGVWKLTLGLNNPVEYWCDFWGAAARRLKRTKFLSLPILDGYHSLPYHRLHWLPWEHGLRMNWPLRLIMRLSLALTY